jgi:hypothetical protein
MAAMFKAVTFSVACNDSGHDANTEEFNGLAT